MINLVQNLSIPINLGKDCDQCSDVILAEKNGMYRDVQYLWIFISDKKYFVNSHTLEVHCYSEAKCI